MTPIRRILGTAGHIDHGKTSLVRALTGIETDRLPQEKERGITIDIGFAHLDLPGADGLQDIRLGIVDVPGHERFIRNMLAGATGVDVAVLVVAADDSVMPQTREHLAILELLDVQVGVIALTKIDRVDADWTELVADDVRELVRGTFLEDAPIVRTSATTGAGLDELRAAIDAAAREVDPPSAGAPFRLAVDRSFVRQGLGTVVTGTVWSGTLRTGDEVAWLPRDERVTVRGIQSHGEDVAEATRGQRAAINLVGVHHDDVSRGDELATPGYLCPTRWLTVRLAVLPESPWPIKHRAVVRVHLGTRELMAETRLLSGTQAEPGSSVWAQFRLAEPGVATHGQPFVVRSESPQITIGGGHVVEPVARRIPRRERGAADRLTRRRDASGPVRVAAAIESLGFTSVAPLDLHREANVNDATAVVDALREQGELVELSLTSTRRVVAHRDSLATMGTRITSALEVMHAAAPLEDAIARSGLAARLNWVEPRLLDAVVDRLIEDRTLRGDERMIALRSFKPKLSAAQRSLRDELVAGYLTGEYQPPDLATIARDRSVDERSLQPIVELCASQGDLVHLGGGSFLHRKWEAELAPRLRTTFGERLFTMSELRDALGTSRKYAVPIGEYLDRIGTTKRIGDKRQLRAPVLESP